MEKAVNAYPTWPYTGTGCDATNGGEHRPFKESDGYVFCTQCGETLKPGRKRTPQPLVYRE